MSKYEIEISIQADDELSKLTGFVKGSEVTLVCDFEYWQIHDSEETGFEFHSVHFYGMNPNGTSVRVCSDQMYETLKALCIDKIRTMEIEAYEAYVKECG
jgi:hypothetical protein